MWQHWCEIKCNSNIICGHNPWSHPGLLIGWDKGGMTIVQGTHHILWSLSVHLYQSLSISTPILLLLPQFPPFSPPPSPFICHSSQLPRSLSLHPRVSPLPATFIYRSQLSVHSIPPQSSTTSPSSDSHKYKHSHAHSQRLKHTKGW